MENIERVRVVVVKEEEEVVVVVVVEIEIPQVKVFFRVL